MSNCSGIVISSLDVTFRSENERLEVLKNFSITIQKGEYTVILGPSGCGKSTFLRILAGTLQRVIPTCEVKGNIEIKLCQGDKEYKIGLAPQSYSLVPWRTVLENVLFPKILTTNKITDQDRERATSILEMLGIGCFGKTYPSELSGGIAQRASLARALFTESDLLLLDEPLNAVDLYERERIQSLLRNYTQKKGITTIHVTHDIYEAAFVASRIILMTGRPGKVHSDICLSPINRDLLFRESKTYHALIAQLRATFNSWTDNYIKPEDWGGQ